MKHILSVAVIALVSFSFYQCADTKKQKAKSETEASAVTEKVQNVAKDSVSLDELWKEVIAYRNKITDTDYLEIPGGMSDMAIYVWKEGRNGGINEAFPMNQMKLEIAIDRAKKHLVYKDNRLTLKLESGKDINVSEDLFKYVRDSVFYKTWNNSISQGIFKVVKNEDGPGYDITPVRKKR